MIYAEFESMLKPVDKKYREKMNQMKTRRKTERLDTENVNTYIWSRQCVHSTFAYRNDLDQ